MAKQWMKRGGQTSRGGAKHRLNMRESGSSLVVWKICLDANMVGMTKSPAKKYEASLILYCVILCPTLIRCCVTRLCKLLPACLSVVDPQLTFSFCWICFGLQYTVVLKTFDGRWHEMAMNPLLVTSQQLSMSWHHSEFAKLWAERFYHGVDGICIVK